MRPWWLVGGCWRHQQNIGAADRERLLGYLEGGGRAILVEPQPLLTQASKMPGLDGQKMSKSYGNTLSLRSGNCTKSTPTNRCRRGCRRAAAAPGSAAWSARPR